MQKNIDSASLQELQDFLESRRLLVLATKSEELVPWVCNMYFSSDEDLNMYFISSPEVLHSKQIGKSPEIAFSIPWFDEKKSGEPQGHSG